MRNGFGDTRNRGVYSLVAYRRYLYAVTRNHNTGMEVWRSRNGRTWRQINRDGFGDASNWLPYSNNSVTVFKRRLHVATLNLRTGGEIWRYIP